MCTPVQVSIVYNVARQVTNDYRKSFGIATSAPGEVFFSPKMMLAQGMMRLDTRTDGRFHYRLLNWTLSALASCNSHPVRMRGGGERPRDNLRARGVTGAFRFYLRVEGWPIVLRDEDHYYSYSMLSC